MKCPTRGTELYETDESKRDEEEIVKDIVKEQEKEYLGQREEGNS